MFRHLLRRSLQTIPVVFFVTVVVFTLMQLAPGDPMDMLVLSNPNVTPEEVERLRAVYGLDDPVYVQYFRWLSQVAQGNLGYSRLYHRPITSILPQRLANTLALTGLSLLLSILIALPIGIYSALRQYSVADYLLSLIAFVGISFPVFWSGILVILLFSVVLGWLPPGGHPSIEPGLGFWGQARYYVAPVLVLSFFSTASWMRYMRSSLLEVIRQDYILTARAKGLAGRVIWVRHALRNALIPIVTLIALTIPALIGGAVVTEIVFSWPGMGRLIFDSLMNNDYYLAMAIFLVFGVLVALFNLLAEVAYAFLDPRIRME